MFLGSSQSRSMYSSNSVHFRGLLSEVLLITSWHHIKGGLVGQIWVHFSWVPSQVTTIILRKVLRHSPSRMSLPFELRTSHIKSLGGARDCHNHQSIVHHPLKTICADSYASRLTMSFVDEKWWTGSFEVFWDFAKNSQVLGISKLYFS